MKQIFLCYFLVSFTIVGFTQSIMKFPNGYTVKETVGKNGMTTYSASNNSGQSIPIKVVNAKKSNQNSQNQDASLCGTNCEFVCYECGTGNQKELCCGCMCGINAQKEFILQKFKGIKKVHSEDNLTIYLRTEKKIFGKKKFSYIGLDGNHNAVPVRVQKAKGPTVDPGDGCYKCKRQGEIIVCEFFPCSKK